MREEIETEYGLVVRHSLYQLIQYNGVGYQCTLLGTFETRKDAQERKGWFERQQGLWNLYVVHHNVFPMKDNREPVEEGTV
jgi:hypothetical protein